MENTMKKDRLLEIEDLSVSFESARGAVCAVNGISYHVNRGETLGIVGESGSGKSVSAYAAMRLLKKNSPRVSGQIHFDGRDVLAMSERELQRFRGEEIGMIFQDPMQCLDPVFTIGDQLTETLRAHKNIRKKEAWQESVQVLESVGIRDGESMMRRYQHELSGGMKQRVMIALALLCSPKLLIADEPTTALDVTIQDQIVGLLKKLCREKNMSMVFITHNFGIVADICDRVCVMYGGCIMEQGSVEQLFYESAHPYTKGLLKAIPKADVTNKERLVPIEGMPNDPFAKKDGCAFFERCPHARTVCGEKRPPFTEIAPGHEAACWLCREEKEAERGE